MISIDAAEEDRSGRRYAAWFHELDAWTEYWDIYQPETRGRFYFGDGQREAGLLTKFLPRRHKPAVYKAWGAMALGSSTRDRFRLLAREPNVADAIVEIDDLVGRLFSKHFADPKEPAAQKDYLEAIFRFATDTLPPAAERDARIAPSDPRKATAGRHTLDGDLMWFAWALQIEAAHEICGIDYHHARRALQLAGVAMGCAANFAWRQHRRTRPEYAANEATQLLLMDRGLQWAQDFESAVQEVHALYRIREWGRDDGGAWTRS